jgi:hypothetical protein
VNIVYCNDATPRGHLAARASSRWPQLGVTSVRYRANFAYIDALLPDSSTQKLCRLRYVGSSHRWQFAIYRASHDDYQDSRFRLNEEAVPRTAQRPVGAASRPVHPPSDRRGPEGGGPTIPLWVGLGCRAWTPNLREDAELSAVPRMVAS